MKTRPTLVLVLRFVALLSAIAGPAFASGLPGTSGHPRLLLTAQKRARLQAKIAASDPSWTGLKEQADRLATFAINPYDYARRTDEPDNTIFYDYQGEGWFSAALPLGLAYQMTGNTAYSDKLLALADEMIRAQSDPANNPPMAFRRSSPTTTIRPAMSARSSLSSTTGATTCWAPRGRARWSRS